MACFQPLGFEKFAEDCGKEPRGLGLTHACALSIKFINIVSTSEFPFKIKLVLRRGTKWDHLDLVGLNI